MDAPGITAAMVARSRSVAEPRWSPDRTRLAWIEAFAGRADLLIAPVDGSGPPVTVTAEPPPSPPGGYGGGVFCWAGPGTLIMAAADGRLVAVPAAGGPARTLVQDGRCYAPAATPEGGLVAFVLERDDTCDVAVVPVDGSSWPARVSSGADYAWDPCWRPDGRMLAWHEWDLPNMPWDGSRIVLRDLDGPRPDGPIRTVAGGDAVATGQPRFAPDASALAFVCDRDGWMNLWAARPDGTRARPLLAESHEHAEPSWGPGQRSFAWSPDASTIALGRNEGGFGRLVVVPRKARARARELTQGWHRGLDWGQAGIAAVHSGAVTPPQAVVVDPANGDRRAFASGTPGGFEAAGLVEPEAVTWRSGRATVHGMLYRPARSTLGPRSKPPLLVHVHGGPTGQAGASWAPNLQFFVDRGWAVLAPEYRGSTGFGRAYAQALAGGWGDLDVADVAAGIRQAARRGWCDPARVAVRGGSAGGLTVLLLAAHHPDLVRAGVSLFGVTDLFDLGATTHRFESRYLDRIVGALPRDADRFRDRSPVTHAAAISVPLLVLQGSADKVVPPAQARGLVDAVRASGGSVEYHEYDGEGHGWSRPETVADDLTRTEAFLRRCVLER